MYFFRSLSVSADCGLPGMAHGEELEGGPGWGRSKVYVTHAIMYEVKVASSCLSLRGRHFLECLIGSGQLVL